MKHLDIGAGTKQEAQVKEQCDASSEDDLETCKGACNERWFEERRDFIGSHTVQIQTGEGGEHNK